MLSKKGWRNGLASFVPDKKIYWILGWQNVVISSNFPAMQCAIRGNNLGENFVESLLMKENFGKFTGRSSVTYVIVHIDIVLPFYHRLFVY